MIASEKLFSAKPTGSSSRIKHEGGNKMLCPPYSRQCSCVSRFSAICVSIAAVAGMIFTSPTLAQHPVYTVIGVFPV